MQRKVLDFDQVAVSNCEVLLIPFQSLREQRGKDKFHSSEPYTGKYTDDAIKNVVPFYDPRNDKKSSTGGSTNFLEKMCECIAHKLHPEPASSGGTGAAGMIPQSAMSSSVSQDVSVSANGAVASKLELWKKELKYEIGLGADRDEEEVKNLKKKIKDLRREIDGAW